MRAPGLIVSRVNDNLLDLTCNISFKIGYNKPVSSVEVKYSTVLIMRELIDCLYRDTYTDWPRGKLMISIWIVNVVFTLTVPTRIIFILWYTGRGTGTRFLCCSGQYRCDGRYYDGHGRCIITSGVFVPRWWYTYNYMPCNTIYVHL